MANGDQDANDLRIRMHDAAYGTLIDKIRRDRYPSTSYMDMVEAGMTDRQLPDYFAALLEKVADDEFPSMDMLKRLTGLV